MSYRLFGFSLLSALFLVSSASADTWSVSLLPADIVGGPGQTVGWTYSIANNSSTNWLVLNSVDADVFLHGTPDSSVFDYPIIAPDSIQTGPLFDFTWDTNAPLNFFNLGTFDLSADWWDSNPLVNVDAVDLGLASPDATADYSVESVPEPATALMAVSALLSMAWIVRRKRRIVS